MAAGVGVWDGLESSFSSGVAAADFDDDGGVDLVVVRSGWFSASGRPLLLHNTVEDRGHWLTVALEGTVGNRQGIGARIVVGRGAQKQIREVSAGAGFLSTHSPWPTFGLGEMERVEVEVRWPSGAIDRFRDIATDRTVTLVEGSGEVSPQPGVAPALRARPQPSPGRAR